MRPGATLIVAALMLWVSIPAGANAAGLFEGERHGHAGRAVVVRPVVPGIRFLSPKSEAYIGYRYEHGLGVPQSFEMAVFYYTSAAERGDPTGQYLLGLMYDKGHGVRQDGIIAHKWLNLAAARTTKQRYRDYFLRLRDAEASKMTQAQIITAQRLAVEWFPKP